MRQSDEGVDFFQQLERHSQVLSPPVQLGFKRDRWLFVAIGVGVLLALVPLEGILGADVAPWSRISGLVLQLVGTVLLAYRQARDVIPDFIDAKRKFAIELDQHFVDRQHVLAWLRSIPAEVRAARLTYVEVRLDTLKSRYPLIFGAVDRLGFLPVLVGVFVQFQALKGMSLLALMLGAAIVALYVMSLWMSRYRLQLEGYIRLMRAADEASA